MNSVDEPAMLDEALVWLLVREQAADAAQRLEGLNDPVARARLVHDLARSVRLEAAVLESREAVALGEVLATIETGLRGAQ